MVHTAAINFLKREISRIVNRTVEIENEIQPLLDEKTELDLLAKEISNSIHKLVQDDESIPTYEEDMKKLLKPIEPLIEVLDKFKEGELDVSNGTELKND